MSVELTGTPVTITWDTTANPDPQDITIPGDATAVYLFWRFYTYPGDGLDTITLNSLSPDEEYELIAGNNLAATGVVAWYNPSTGTQSVDVSWDASFMDYGPTCIVVFVKGGDTSGWRDADAAATLSTEECSVTIDSNTTDLVIKCDGKYNTTPGTSSGWTSQQTHSYNDYNARLSTADNPGASTTDCDCEDEYYSSIVAISIINVGGGGGNAPTGAFCGPLMGSLGGPI